MAFPVIFRILIFEFLRLTCACGWRVCFSDLRKEIVPLSLLSRSVSFLLSYSLACPCQAPPACQPAPNGQRRFLRSFKAKPSGSRGERRRPRPHPGKGTGAAAGDGQGKKWKPAHGTVCQALPGQPPRVPKAGGRLQVPVLCRRPLPLLCALRREPRVLSSALLAPSPQHARGYCSVSKLKIVCIIL